jgi:hypothetical protein
VNVSKLRWMQQTRDETYQDSFCWVSVVMLALIVSWFCSSEGLL